ncbi:hypothetical protein SCLCIDRAFT_1213189 [Scleroderma citrinum Foug A]|uniref:Uncharacterized protein n=1 Tax=Scleroderma citrinum Foug A TaxID=1036808 RepID=A0A0C3AIG0_9AGAM|nr:hypothetical protein SCLCIDRAFT_1213189 [Scleroderma citrinum Foug A]
MPPFNRWTLCAPTRLNQRKVRMSTLSSLHNEHLDLSAVSVPLSSITSIRGRCHSFFR